MGYETTMLIVEGKEKKGKPAGYHSVIASVELSCCGGNGYMGKLIQKLKTDDQKPKDKLLYEEVSDAENEHKKCFNAEGNWVEELEHASKKDQDKVTNKYYSMIRKIEAKLPYVYWNNQNSNFFIDNYGSLLIVATIKEAYEALIRDQAQYYQQLLIDKKEYSSINGYRRFHLAIKVLEGFIQNESCWSGVKVILYGH